MADDTVTSDDDTRPTEEEEEAPVSTEQDGGLADSRAERFEDHKWESDEDWQLLLRGLDFGILSDDRKAKYIEKRKHKYFKEKIDPSHEIPKVTPRSRGSRYQAPPSAATADSSTTDNNNDNSDNNDNAANDSQAQAQASEDNDNNNDNDSGGSNNEDKEKEKERKEREEKERKQRQQQQQQQQQQRQRTYRNRRPQLTKVQEMLNYFFVIMQWFVFINCVLSIVMPSSHYRALYGVIGMHIVALIQNTGRPQFNMYYAQRMFQDENVMIAIYGLMFLMGPPVFVFLIPIALRSLHMGSYMLNALTQSKAPAIYAKIHPILVKVTSKYYWFMSNIALAEVGVGIFLIPACFFISRTVILTLFYWQIMHARYMMSQPIKTAFTTVNLKLESIFSRVPAVLNIYRKIANFLYDKVDPVKLQEQMRQQQQGGGAGAGMGSMLKKCTIM